MGNKVATTDILVENEMFNFASPKDAEFLQRFFKTGPGQYGQGDKFLGIRNPQTRSVAKKYYKIISNEEIEKLLHSEWHEIRLCALVIMTLIFNKADFNRQEQLYSIYAKNISKYVNNWDLVDLSAPNIVGAYLTNKNRSELYTLAQGDLWQKRVSILATFTFIRQKDFYDAIKISEILMYEKHDLLHKAVGWMLREIGKRDEDVLKFLLNEYASSMPRTTLRYSIEKFPPEIRNYYLNLKNH
jgi:3-methyladenine DNA glycosylase AlkD